jgi:biotin carboxylase
MTLRVLSIGAGAEQFYPIQTAMARGLEVVALDGNAAAPGLSVASRGLVVDISNQAAVLEVARTVQPDFLLPAPIGQFLTTVGAVNSVLGLRGISLDAARLCTDKRATFQCLAAAGIRVARQIEVQGRRVSECLAEIGLPCILKPARGSGSRGVRLLSGLEDVLIADAMVADDPEQPWLLEEVLLGVEFGVDAAVYAGQFRLVMAREKIMTAPPARQEMTYIYPPRVSDVLVSGVSDIVERASRAMGLSDCLINADVMLSPDGEPAIIELSGRAPGNNITSRLFPAVSGANLIDLALDALIDNRPLVSPHNVRPVAFSFLPVPAGRVLSVQLSGPDPAIGWIACDSPLKTGDLLDPIASGSDAMARGWIMATGDTPDQALSAAQAYIQTMEVQIDRV